MGFDREDGIHCRVPGCDNSDVMSIFVSWCCAISNSCTGSMRVRLVSLGSGHDSSKSYGILWPQVPVHVSDSYILGLLRDFELRD